MANRQTRDPGAIRRFNETGHISAGVPGWAVDDGQAFRALADVSGGLSARLGKLADAAAARQGTQDLLQDIGASGAAYLRMQAAEGAGKGKAPANAAAVKAYLTDRHGYSDIQASAITGHLIQESGLRFSGAVGDAGTAFGGAQWRGARFANLKNFAGKQGRNWQDMETQLDFIVHELGTSETTAGKALSEATTLDDAVAAFMHFERPAGYTRDNPRGGHAYAARLANARGLTGAGGVQRSGKAAPATPIVPVLPETPLALRNDGTIYGDAYDRAARNAVAWRMQAGLSSGMQAAFEANQDDPQALAGALAQLQDDFGKDPNLADPELGEAFSKQFFERSEPYLRAARANAEKAMRETETVAAFEGMAAQRLDIERQAVALGANPEGDRIVQREVERGGRAIDAAVAAGTLSPAQGSTQKEDLAITASLGRVRGVYEALDTPDAKEAFASGLLEEWTDGKGPLAKLPYDKVKALSATLWNDARQKRNEASAETRIAAARLTDLVNDDIASVEATGKGIETLQPADVEAALGPLKFAEWRDKRATAERTWRAVAGMETEPGAAIAERLATLEPVPGQEGFADQARIAAVAGKNASAILKQRAADPSAAVEASFPQVAALAAEADPQNPDSLQALVAGRLQAQAALDIGELGRQPLTNAEALSLARAVSGQPDPQMQAQAMNELVGQVQAAYGPHADAVLTQILQVRGMDREMAAYGSQLFRKMNSFEGPTISDRRQGAVLSETAAADNAGKAQAADDAAILPNYQQQQMLLSRPWLAPQFDEKFGAGAAERLLGQRRAAGAPLVTKDEKGTATLNADGSEDWSPN